MEGANFEVGVAAVFVGVDLPVGVEVETGEGGLVTALFVCKRSAVPTFCGAIKVEEVVVEPSTGILMCADGAVAFGHFAEADATHYFAEIVDIAHNAAVVGSLFGG